MNSVLLWIGGVLIAVLALAFAAPYAIDWNSYRGVFEEEATRILGREVRVGGQVNLRLLPVPYVRFEKLRIANAEGRNGEPFLRADNFILRLAVPPLFRGAIEAKDVEIEHLELNLAIAPDGSGNWPQLRLSRGALPFVPSDVALQSVKIKNSTVSLDLGSAQVALTAVTGELAADQLSGPYKFVGAASWNGLPREVRLATSALEADSLRIKLTVRAPNSANSYGLDGQIANLTHAPRFEGSATGRLPLPAGVNREPLPPAAPRPGQRGEDAFDLKAAVVADAHGVKVTDINAGLDQDGRPQLITGEATATWDDGLDLDAHLQSRWLDLDRIAPQGNASPLASLRDVAARLAELIPGEGRARVAFDADQLNLGGEPLTAARMRLEHGPQGLRLEELRAQLPGGTRLDVHGQLGAGGGTTAAPPDSRLFDGEVVLRGTSLQRFLAWAGKPNLLPPIKADGSFLLASGLKLAAASISLDNAAAELGSVQVRGSLGYGWQGRPQLTLKLEGGDIDLSSLAPGLLDWSALRNLLAAAESAPAPLDTAATSTRWLGPGGGKIDLQVRAGQISDGTRSARDVEAELAIDAGALTISTMKFNLPGGLKVEAAGSLAEAAGAPKGSVNGWITAPSRTAAGELVSLVRAVPGLESAPLPSFETARLGIAGSFGRRLAGSTEIRIDGTIDASRMVGTLALDGGPGGWRQAGIDGRLRLDGVDAGAIMRGLLPDREVATPGPAVPSATLDISTAGSSASDLAVLAELRSSEFSAIYKGRGASAADGALSLDGEATVATTNLARALALAGVRRQPGLADVALSGSVGLTRSTERLTLQPRDVKLGNARVSGRIELGAGGPQTTHVDASLAVDQAAIGDLIAVLLDGRAQQRAGNTAASPAQAGAAAGDPELWPDVPFQLANVDNLDGKLALSIGTLRLADGLGVADAALDVDLGRGAVDVTRLTGGALGGQLNGNLRFERAPAGATLTGALRLDGIDLTRLGTRADGRPLAQGQATLTSTVQGRALSPRALIGALEGHGVIELAAAGIAGLPPQAVADAVERLLAQAEPPSDDGLARGLLAAKSAGSLPLGSRKITFELRDGAARLAPLDLTGPDGRAHNETTVDLASLRFDSEWRIEATARTPAAGPAAAAPQRARSALPPVSVVHVGNLGQLMQVQPRILTESLWRELSLRRTERDVERLESLRRQDEDLARQEALRQPEPPRTNPAQPDSPAGGGSAPQPPVLVVPFPVPARPVAPEASTPAAPPAATSAKRSSNDGRGGLAVTPAAN